MARPDDDALSWDGDDDPTLDTGAPAATTPGRSAAPIDEPAVLETSPREPATAEATEVEPAALPKGYNAVGKDAGTVGRVHSDGSVTMPGDRKPMGNTALITLGVLGGFYLIFTIGWIIGGLRLQGSAQYLVTDIMFQGSFWLAVLAPALWFGTVFLLTRNSAGWVRIVWLVAGAVLLVPWPFIMVGAVGL